MILCNVPAINLLFFSWIILGIFQKHFLKYWKIILEYDGDYYIIISEIFHEMILCNIPAINLLFFSWIILGIFQKHFLEYWKKFLNMMGIITL